MLGCTLTRKINVIFSKGVNVMAIKRYPITIGNCRVTFWADLKYAVPYLALWGALIVTFIVV